MDIKKYFFAMLMAFLCLVLTIGLVAGALESLFLKEMYLIVFLVFMLALASFGLIRMLQSSWLIFAMFFGIMMLNNMYVYLNGVEKPITSLFLMVFAIIGFISAVFSIKCVKKAYTEPAIVDLPEPPKPPKKTVKKKAKKSRKKKK